VHSGFIIGEMGLDCHQQASRTQNSMKSFVSSSGWFPVTDSLCTFLWRSTLPEREKPVVRQIDRMRKLLDTAFSAFKIE
jgi:hypothetical protein